MSTFSDLVGSTSEYKARLWLQKQYPRMTVDATSHFSTLDRRGIDLVGRVGERVVLCAQVKTSEKAAQAFVAYNRFDQRISVIVAPVDASPYFYHMGKVDYDA
jgi:hypothetical protein